MITSPQVIFARYLRYNVWLAGYELGQLQDITKSWLYQIIADSPFLWSTELTKDEDLNRQTYWERAKVLFEHDRTNPNLEFMQGRGVDVSLEFFAQRGDNLLGQIFVGEENATTKIMVNNSEMFDRSYPTESGGFRRWVMGETTGSLDIKIQAAEQVSTAILQAFVYNVILSCINEFGVGQGIYVQSIGKTKPVQKNVGSLAANSPLNNWEAQVRVDYVYNATAPKYESNIWAEGYKIYMAFQIPGDVPNPPAFVSFTP